MSRRRIGAIPREASPDMTTDTVETAAPKKPSPVSHASRDALQKLGERIREARQRIGMNQLELAGDDLTRNMISRIETGSALPSIQTLCIIADRLGVPAGALLSDLDDYFAYRMAGEMRSLLERHRYQTLIDRVRASTERDRKIKNPALAAVFAEACAGRAAELFTDGRLAEARSLAEESISVSGQCLTPSTAPERAWLVLALTDLAAEPLRSETPDGTDNQTDTTDTTERRKELDKIIFGENETAIYLLARDMLDEAASKIYSSPAENSAELEGILSPLVTSMPDGFMRTHVEAKLDMLRSDYLDAKAKLVRICGPDDEKNADRLPPSIRYDILNDLEHCCKCCGDFENAYRFSTEKIAMLQKIR